MRDREQPGNHTEGSAAVHIASFAIPRPRPRRNVHPLARLLFLLAGAAVAALFLMLGALALLVMLAVGAVALVVRTLQGHGATPRPHPDQTSDPRVLEGHCVVLDPPQR